MAEINNEDHVYFDPEISEKVHLHRLAREMAEIRKLVSKVVNYIGDAESEVPEKLRRFANYYHDVHDIKYMYEEHGSPVPEHLLSEIRRLDDRYRQILKTYNSDGGALEKIRREMAADKENRYNHTLQLSKPKENGADETRPSE
jgi:hypothetical protein